MKKIIIGIIAIIIVIMLVFVAFIYIGSSDYFVDEFAGGEWGTEILLEYEDGSTQSLKMLFDNPTMAMYHGGEKITGMYYKLNGRATGEDDHWTWELNVGYNYITFTADMLQAEDEPEAFLESILIPGNDVVIYQLQEPLKTYAWSSYEADPPWSYPMEHILPDIECSIYVTLDCSLTSGSLEIDISDYFYSLELWQDSSRKHDHVTPVTSFVNSPRSLPVDGNWHLLFEIYNTVGEMGESSPDGIYTFKIVPSGSLRYRASGGSWITADLPSTVSFDVEIQTEDATASITVSFSQGYTTD